METARKYWIYIALGVLGLNGLILDFYLFLSPKAQPSQAIVPGKANIPNFSQNVCSKNCIDQMNLILKSQKETASSLSAVLEIELIPTLAITSTPSPTTAPIKLVKEFFVPLGTGTGNSADWKVVDGIGAKIDSADYGDIKQITFEVSVKIPTGNQTIWVRLYNATTSQSIAGSEMTLAGGTATLLVSSPISLASGNNLYQIQMKTQLQYAANIEMSRLRIKTN